MNLSLKSILEFLLKVVDVLDLSIVLVLTTSKKGDDVEFEKVLIDKASLEIISGSTIDFKVEMIGESFVINNPKATASCGCGLSFSV